MLNYIATSNHVHLLAADRGNNEIAKSMQLVASRTAQEYNKRKKRAGAFWEDRYHATAVQTDQHLLRCLVYIDLNMVRAGVVKHPRDWEISGFHEIQEPRCRKGIIDHSTLCQLVGVSAADELQLLHAKWVAAELPNTRRDPAWTESSGVGDEWFLTELKSQLGAAGLHKHIKSGDGVQHLREGRNCYTY